MEVIFQNQNGHKDRLECGCVSEGDTGLFLYKFDKQKSSNQIGYVPFEKLYHVEPSEEEAKD